MIVCRGCGANCDNGEVKQGLCEDCRDSEPEFRMVPTTTDRRRQKAYEQAERNGFK